MRFAGWVSDVAPAHLQPLALNPYVRRRSDNAFCRTGFGNRFNCPRPTEVAIFVERPSSATAFPDLHSPVIAVSRDCEHKCDCCRNHHSAQHSDQKYASHCSHKFNRWGLFRLLRMRQILPCHSGAVPCSLFCTSASPTFPLLRFEARRQAGFPLQRP
jgi:hypothetical protein